MSMVIGNTNIALVEFRRNAVETNAFKSRLELVLAVMNNGEIGGGEFSYYGSDEHLEALSAIEEQLRYVRGLIEDDRRQKLK